MRSLAGMKGKATGRISADRVFSTPRLAPTLSVALHTAFLCVSFLVTCAILVASAPGHEQPDDGIDLAEAYDHNNLYQTACARSRSKTRHGVGFGDSYSQAVSHKQGVNNIIGGGVGPCAYNEWKERGKISLSLRLKKRKNNLTDWALCFMTPKIHNDSRKFYIEMQVGPFQNKPLCGKGHYLTRGEAGVRFLGYWLHALSVTPKHYLPPAS